MSAANSDWRPTATIEMLKQRAKLLADVRRFFDSQGFIEVQTPVLSHDTLVDRFIDPISVATESVGATQRLFLQTSPEFAMKRLLCAGATAIYQMGPAFRGGEQGARHNPEFTMLEWYCTGDSYAGGMQRLSEFCQAILQTPPAERISYREAFERAVGLNPLTASERELASRWPESIPYSDGCDRDELLNLLRAEWVEPNLGRERPQIVYDWPATQAALAKIRHDQPAIAERFELYVGGCELANGYHELTDPVELQRRMEDANRRRTQDRKPALPVDSRLIQATRESPPPDCCGVAVGIDRLLMVKTGAKSMREVVAFPFDIA